MKIKVGDMVQVIAGDDRGTRAKVLRVDRDTGKIVVEGVNRVYKHVKRSQRNMQGGRLSKEMPISVSNVMLLCQQTNKPNRTGVRFTPDGAKERFCRKSGSSAGMLAPPHAGHKQK